MDTSSPTLAIQGADVKIGDTTILRGVDLRIGDRECVAIVGPSGAGKTTLLRLLNGTVTPTSGQVFFEGLDLAELSRRALQRVRARIGFVHQDHALVPNLRVSQNVLAGRLGSRGLAASLRSLTWASRSDLEEVHALLERLGIAEKMFERTDTLSGGQRQRVAIARALFQRPHALLADEPVASVDPARARDLLEMLGTLAAEEGMTLVASLHDLSLARACFPRTLGLRAGAVAFDRPTADVRPEELRALFEISTSQRDG